MLNYNISKTPNHTYFDASICNNDTVGNQRQIQASVNITRTNPIIDNCEDYYCSVINFQISSSSLPLFIPLCQIGQNDPNLLIYQITLTYGGFTQTENVIWSPVQLNASIPQPPITQQYIDNDYYFCYSYQYFINLINNTFQTCYNNLNTQVAGALPTSKAPFIELNLDNYKFILNADELGYDLALTTPIKIYFNAPLFTLFGSLQAYNYGNLNAPKNFQLLVNNINNSNIYSVGSINYLQSYGEFSSLPAWNCVKSIVFSSNKIPVIPEQITPSQIFNSEIALGNDIANSCIDSMITDFKIDLVNGTESKPIIQYSPSTEYRLIDLIGNNPLYGLDLNVYWVDTFNIKHPYYLNSGEYLSFKMLFRKKSFNGL